MCHRCGNLFHNPIIGDPERGFSTEHASRTIEVFEASPELIDALLSAEKILNHLIEAGDNLQTLDREALDELLEYFLELVGRLNIRIESDTSIEEIRDGLARLRSSIDDVMEGRVGEVLRSLGVKNEIAAQLRPVIEKIIILRQSGLDDRNIYLRLVRTYHPDVTVYSQEKAQEIFKLIGQHLYDARRQLFAF